MLRANPNIIDSDDSRVPQRETSLDSPRCWHLPRDCYAVSTGSSLTGRDRTIIHGQGVGTPDPWPSSRSRVLGQEQLRRMAGQPPPLLVDDLHAKGLLVFVFVVVDVNQDLLLPGSLTGRKPQADGVGLTSPDLERNVAIIVPTQPAPQANTHTHTPYSCPRPHPRAPLSSSSFQIGKYTCTHTHTHTPHPQAGTLQKTHVHSEPNLPRYCPALSPLAALPKSPGNTSLSPLP